ncbi:MAG: hypothetical protein ABI921_12705, partial [Panacibacter sp.]
IGIDMGFNTHHHHDEEATETTVHLHANGKKHDPHDETAKHHHDSKEDSEKDGCCNDGVIKFQSLDKSLSGNANTSITLPVFIAIVQSYHNTDIFKHKLVSAQKYLLPFSHPPPPDIRILIQSFQI